MTWLDRILNRHGADDLAEEMRNHIEERTEQIMRVERLSRSEARRAALLAFGNPVLVQTRSREIWQWVRLESMAGDLKLAVRRLSRAPGFAATVLLTLAIGIGANAAVFSVVNSVLLKPLPYPDSDRLVSLWLNAPGAGGLANFEKRLPLSTSMYFAFSENNRTFQSLGIWIPAKSSVTGLALPEEVHTILLSDGVLESLGVPAAEGRELRALDQDPAGAKNVVLSFGYWQRRFGGDRSVIGRSIIIDSQTRTIVGVMPRGFRIVDQDFDVLVPLAVERNKQPLAGFGFQGIGRLRPGVTISAANADIARTIPIWMNSFSNGPGTDSHWYIKWRITPDFRLLKQEVIGDVGSVLWVVMGTIALVFLMACLNVANLLMVRAEARQAEITIRAALGAGRGRIARELLFESVLLGLGGGMVGSGVAVLALRTLVRIGPENLPRLHEISLDGSSLCFTLFLSVVCGLFFGSIPAWRYSRPRPVMNLCTTRSASVGREQQRSRNILVVAQVSMALVLMIVAALMLRTFDQLRMVDPGFADPGSVQTLRIAIPESAIADQRLVTRVENNIADRFGSVPGVTSVGFGALVPMEEGPHGWSLIYAEGRTYPGDAPIRFYNYVSPGYFHALGTRLLAGRDFSWQEIYDSRPSVIVSENLAREEWGSAAAAIGKRIGQGPGLLWYQVIGVAQDLRHNGVDQRAPATVYWPVLSVGPWLFPPRAVTFVVRSSRAGTQPLLQDLERAVWQVNADLPVASPRTMQQIYAKSLARTSFTLVMLAIAAAMAFALGIIGIYGVISYAVSRRRREIGLRLALGAQKGELRWLFVRSALGLTAVGIGLGLGGAALVARLMAALLFGVRPIDPLSFVTVPLLLAAATALASYLPASRATNVDPVDALRAE